MSTIKGFVDYQKREYCRAVKCPVQLELESYAEGSNEYEDVRYRCKTACIHTTHEFHSWLTKEGYVIVKPE